VNPLGAERTLSSSCDLGQQQEKLRAGQWVDLNSAPSSQKLQRLPLGVILAANSDLGSLGAAGKGHKPMTVHTI
jgi:hypothetical protein